MTTHTYSNITKQFINNTREKLRKKNRAPYVPLLSILIPHGLNSLKKQLFLKLLYEILRTFVDIFRWLVFQLLRRRGRLSHFGRIRPLYFSGEILHRPFCFFLNFFDFGCAVVKGIQGTTHFFKLNFCSALKRHLS